MVEWALQNCDPPQRHQFNTNIQSKRLYAHLKSYSKRKATHHIKENAHKIIRGLQSRRASLVAQTVKKICLQCRPGFDPWVGKIPWKRKWQPTPVFLPREFHGQEEPTGLQSMRSQGVTHNWATNTSHGRNLISQRKAGWHVQNVERKKCQPRIISHKTVLQSEREIKTSPDKQSLMEFITTRPA